MVRILVGGLSHELNSFVGSVTTLDDIREAGRLALGDEMFRAKVGLGSQLDAAQDIAREEGIELIPTLDAAARSGGPVSDDAYLFLRDALVAAAGGRLGQVDGVYLSLHGAMAAESFEDVEGDVLEHVRSVVGPTVPVVASLDLHAHVTDRMARNADALIAFRTHPHIDFYETGERAMALLLDAIRGRTQPVVRQRKLRMMASAERHDTNDGPMVGVMDLAREMEQRPGILAVSVIPTQPWMDVADLGWSTVVVSDGNAALAQYTADELARTIWERREAFRVVKTPLDEAVQEALATSGRPVVMVDAADATTGGANGDSNSLLRELLRIGYDGAALLTITDPAAAAAATAAGEGATITLPLGGAQTQDLYAPIEVTARVEALRDGRFETIYPPGPFDIGPTAVLAINGIRVVVSQTKPYHLDDRIYTMAGLDPRVVDMVQVKSNGGFRAVYGAFAARIIQMDTPGPCDSDLTRLPFRRIPRPMWPWDPNLERPWPDARPRPTPAGASG